MFYHRVLPPPPNLVVSPRNLSPAPVSTLPVSGSTDEDRMTTIADRPSFSHVELGRLRNPSLREQEELQHSKHHRDRELSSPISLRSSVRISRQREASRSPPPGPGRSSETRLPSISKDGELTSQVSPTQVCLCQPDPKVPRPRNGMYYLIIRVYTLKRIAFILFRQHHQAAVVAQNPGLANPDISKIIGDAWRTSSTDIKNHWKKLAEEEKVRHQKLYPDYRYQPRRAGRNSLTNSVVTDPETQRCLKCGGKTMQTYNNLPTPGTPTSPRLLQPNHAMLGTTVLSRGSRYIGSPSYPPGAVDLRRFPQSNGGSSLSLRQRDQIPQNGPDPKRRRYDGPTSPPPRPGSVTFPPSFSQSGRRPSMPHPEISTRGHSLSISRPQPPSGNPIRAPGPALAPLQIDKTRDTASHVKAVEAMVMSIPALNKIKVLSKISPPLPPPGPASPPHDTRGALIAIEGSDEEAIKLTTTYLKEYLERDGDYKVRLLLKPVEAPFEDNASWLNKIMSYHQESRDIVKYITTFPSSETYNRGSEVHRDLKTVSDISKKGSSQEDDPMSSPPASPTPTTASINPFQRVRHPIPIIIAPRYQLSLTDLAASQIAINDEYSPTDHWQWMATLWRGIVGPDVTIDIRTPGYLHGGGSSGTSSPRNAATSPPIPLAQSRSSGGSPVGAKDANMTGISSSSGGSGGAAAAANAGGQHSAAGGNNIPVVDVRLQDARAVFLRGEAGGKVREAGLRRTGFEVGEWLRDVESREHERELREKGR